MLLTVIKYDLLTIDLLHNAAELNGWISNIDCIIYCHIMIDLKSADHRMYVNEGRTPSSSLSNMPDAVKYLRGIVKCYQKRHTVMMQQ